MFFYQKTSNFRNSGLVGRKKMRDSLMNNINGVLSIDLQDTISFKWPNFDLKYLVTIRLVYEIFPFLKQVGLAIHFLSLLVIIQLLLWNNKKRNSTGGHVLFEPL